MTDLWVLMVKRLSILTTNMSFVRCTIPLTFCVLVTVQSTYTQTTLSSILVLRGRLTLLNTCDGYDRVLRMVSHRRDCKTLEISKSDACSVETFADSLKIFSLVAALDLVCVHSPGLTEEAFEMMVQILLREETLTILLPIYKAPKSFIRKGANVTREPCTI